MNAADEACEDCGRFEARNRPADDWQQFEREDCWKSYGANSDRGRCNELTIARLRTENARLLAELEATRATIAGLENEVFELQMGDDL